MPRSAKAAVVRARIDQEIKDRATVVLDVMGLTVSDVLREVLVRLAQEKELPFQVRTAMGGVKDVKLPTITEEQFWAEKQARQAVSRARVANGEVPRSSMLMFSAEELRGSKIEWPNCGFSASEDDDVEEHPTPALQR